MKSQIGR